MNNNRIYGCGKRGILNTLLVGAASLALTLFGGCSNDMGVEEYAPDTGSRTHTTVSLNLTTSSADVVTRGLDMNGSAVKIETLWIGVFDTKTGEQVGRMAGHVRKDDGNRFSVNNGKTFEITDLDIYYYDANPEVYIVAVANYDRANNKATTRPVMARFAGTSGELQPLSTLLGIDTGYVDSTEAQFDHTITWQEFCSISVDTGSVTENLLEVTTNAENQRPLMMGFFSEKVGGVNITVNNSGKSNRDGDIKVRLVEDPSNNFSKKKALSGRIEMRRLVSEVTVRVPSMSAYATGPDGLNYPPIYKPLPPESDDDDPDPDATEETTAVSSPVRVKKLAYRIMNKPREVFLAEHATDTRGAYRTDRDSYLANTANSADFLADGYESDEEWTDAEFDGFFYTFKFIQYENKHWGHEWEMAEELNPDLYGDDRPTPPPSVPSPPGWPEWPRSDVYTWAHMYERPLDDAMDIYEDYWEYPYYYQDDFDWSLENYAYSWEHFMDWTFIRYAAYFFREAKHDGESRSDKAPDIFRTLNNDAANPFNNNASYIQLKADVHYDRQTNLYDGREYYRESHDGEVIYNIHEGYTSAADGTEIDLLKPHKIRKPSYNSEAEALEAYKEVLELYKNMIAITNDYQTYRNTQYDYFISIGGTNQLWMQVSTFGNNYYYDGPDDIYHFDGIEGKDSRLTTYAVHPLGIEARRGYDYPQDYGDYYYPSRVFGLYVMMDEDQAWRICASDNGKDYIYGWGEIADHAQSNMPAGALSDPANMPDAIANAFTFQCYEWMPEDGYWVMNTQREYKSTLTLKELLTLDEDWYKDSPRYGTPGLKYLFVIDIHTYDTGETTLSGIQKYGNRKVYICEYKKDVDSCTELADIMCFDQTPLDTRPELEYYDGASQIKNLNYLPDDGRVEDDYCYIYTKEVVNFVHFKAATYYNPNTGEEEEVPGYQVSYGNYYDDDPKPTVFTYKTEEIQQYARNGGGRVSDKIYSIPMPYYKDISLKDYTFSSLTNHMWIPVYVGIIPIVDEEYCKPIEMYDYYDYSEDDYVSNVGDFYHEILYQGGGWAPTSSNTSNTFKYRGSLGFDSEGRAYQYECGGIILYGGVSGSNNVTVNDSYINIVGSGYPINFTPTTKSRCFEITIDRPGKFAISARAANTGTTRKVHLYKTTTPDVKPTTPVATQELQDQTSTREGFELETGPVSGLTTIYITPENSVYFFSIEFIPSED